MLTGCRELQGENCPPHIKTRCSRAPEMWSVLWIELWGSVGIFRTCRAHPSKHVHHSFSNRSKGTYGGGSGQVACVYVYIVWRANWRMVTYLRDGEDSWPGVWRRALCVETTVTSLPAQNNLPARTGLSVVCLHWELFQTAHAHAHMHGTLNTSRKYVYPTVKKISHRAECSSVLLCVSLTLFTCKHKHLYYQISFLEAVCTRSTAGLAI